MSDRVAEFLVDRLRGRAVPEDLRRLVELQLDGRLAGSPQPLLETRVLAPGQSHPLQDEEFDERDLERAALAAAFREVVSHLAPIASGFNNDLWGYWMHPAEPADRPPLVVRYDTEGQFGVYHGMSLVGAMVQGLFGDVDEEDVDEEDEEWVASLREVLEYCHGHAIPRTADNTRARPGDGRVEPAALERELYARAVRRLRRERYGDPAPAPADPTLRRVVDGAELVGLLGRAFEDEAVVAALAGLGVGALRPQALDEPVVAVPEAGVTLSFSRLDPVSGRRRDAGPVSGLRFQVRDGAGGRGFTGALPFGFTAAETRPQALDRMGPPRSSNGTSPQSVRWQRSEQGITAVYDEADQLVCVIVG